MQAITSPVALKLSEEVKKAIASDEVVAETLSRQDELEQLKEYVKRQIQKGAEKAAEKAAQSAEQKAKEEMIIMAIQNNAVPALIEVMCQNAGITESRLAELKKLAQM